MSANLEALHSDAWRRIGVADTALKVIALIGMLTAIVALIAAIIDAVVAKWAWGAAPSITLAAAIAVVVASVAALAPLQSRAKRSFVAAAERVGFTAREAGRFWDEFDWDGAEGSVG